MSSLNRGGAETVVLEWLRNIGPEDIPFDFIVSEGNRPHDFEQEALSLGASIVQSPRFCGWNFPLYLIWWTRTLAAHPEWKIVHAHHATPASLFLPLAKLARRCTYAHSHSAGTDSGVYGVLKRISTWPLRHLTHYRFACSQAAGIYLFGSRSKFRILPNGINCKVFEFSHSKRTIIRDELGVGKDTLLIGHIGRFNHEKNHSRLIEIFVAITEKHPDSHLLLVGTGELENTVNLQVKALSLNDKVTFAGVREDIPEILSSLDVFLLPSLYEGLPVVAVEAQANGVPCVFSSNITPEAQLTNLVTFISLSASDDIWSTTIINLGLNNRHANRQSKTQEIDIKGYSSHRVLKELQTIYSTHLDNGVAS